MCSGSFFFEGGVLDDEINIDPSMLRIHELLEEYYLDKMISNPIPYDENHAFFSGFETYVEQDKLKELLRFDSIQIKSLINADLGQQAVIDRLEAENQKLKTALAKSKTYELTESQGYLNPNNKFFSIEMELCHDTWNELYKDGNSSHLAHTTQVANYLKNYTDFTVNTKAIERISTITNPKHKLAGTTAKTDK